jgi:hypothetical protein
MALFDLRKLSMNVNLLSMLMFCYQALIIVEHAILLTILVNKQSALLTFVIYDSD